MLKVKERPVVFSREMVRATLAGRKTLLLHVINPQPACGCYYSINGAGDAALHLAKVDEKLVFVQPKADSPDHRLPCPFGVKGNHLWVKENCLYDPQRQGRIAYAADIEGRALGLWPAKKMFRQFSRITLEITDIDVLRLQEIEPRTVLAAGIKPGTEYDIVDDNDDCEGYMLMYDFHQLMDSFKRNWDYNNTAKGHGWDANPWVWAITYKRVEV